MAEATMSVAPFVMGTGSQLSVAGFVRFIAGLGGMGYDPGTLFTPVRAHRLHREDAMDGHHLGDGKTQVHR